MSNKLLFSKLTFLLLIFCIQSWQIYGVRWFLGSHYSFNLNKNNPSNEYYKLIFNANEINSNTIFLLINNYQYSCLNKTITINNTGNHQSIQQNHSYKGQIQNYFQYTCNVNQEFKQVSEVQYQIVIRSIKYDGQNDKYHIVHDKEVVFQGQFRIPNVLGDQSFLIIGDWGQITAKTQAQKGYLPILPCLLKNVTDNKQIKALLFVGDIAYDFQGLTAVNMLKYIQPITSIMVFIGSPGNHDTVHHIDTFKLYTQSFFTPQWSQYFNYFSTIQFQDLVLISYNPQQIIFGSIDRINQSLSTILAKQLTKQIQSQLLSNYKVIVFSHYSIYCSDINDDLQTCDKNQIILNQSIQYFKNIGIDLYISAHLHVYERTKPICWNSQIQNKNKKVQKIYQKQNEYSMQCPVFIVEGDGGNDYYVQTKMDYPKRNFSAALGENTGYGILNIVRQNSKVIRMQFEHISIQQNCKINDSFVLNQQLNKKTQMKSNFKLLLLLILLPLVTCFLLTIFNLQWIIKKCKLLTKKILQHHKIVQQAPQNAYEFQ